MVLDLTRDVDNLFWVAVQANHTRKNTREITEITENQMNRKVYYRQIESSIAKIST